jgi:hypothetical protein
MKTRYFSELLSSFFTVVIASEHKRAWQSRKIKTGFRHVMLAAKGALLAMTVDGGNDKEGD